MKHRIGEHERRGVGRRIGIEPEFLSLADRRRRLPGPCAQPRDQLLYIGLFGNLFRLGISPVRPSRRHSKSLSHTRPQVAGFRKGRAPPPCCRPPRQRRSRLSMYLIRSRNSRSRSELSSNVSDMAPWERPHRATTSAGSLPSRQPTGWRCSPRPSFIAEYDDFLRICLSLDEECDSLDANCRDR